MTTDNTTPRLTAELIARHARLETMIARVPIVVRRLDMEQPGFPTGHTGSPSSQDGPDRWQTSDPAYQATKALLKGVQAVCREVDDLDRLLANWSMAVKPSSVRDSTSSEHCVSCIRIGSVSPRYRTSDLCRWCAGTLKAVNDRRGELGLPDVPELPTVLVHKHAQGRRLTLGDIDHAARHQPKGKR
jgi:hypothetical protein